jgi:putative transcriptional regulator
MGKPIIISKNIQDTLAGCLLVATPQLQDDFFHHAVVYMCSHNQEGAMGVIVNAPVEKISINDILDQMQLGLRAGDRKLPVLFGGPVEAHRGFLMHNGEYQQESAISARDGITVTANSAVLTGWLAGDFPASMLLALGYSGWTAGQLESEIESGSWVVVPATQHLLFDTPHEAKWDLAIASLGFDMGNFSSTVGHA